MAQDTWWPVQVLIKCPNQMVRQMFLRLCIHVIQRLRQSHAPLYLLMDDGMEGSVENMETPEINTEKIGNQSCVTKFVKTLLSLVIAILYILNYVVIHSLLDGTWCKGPFKTFDRIFWFLI